MHMLFGNGQGVRLFEHLRKLERIDNIILDNISSLLGEFHEAQSSTIS